MIIFVYPKMNRILQDLKYYKLRSDLSGDDQTLLLSWLAEMTRNTTALRRCFISLLINAGKNVPRGSPVIMLNNRPRSKRNSRPYHGLNSERDFSCLLDTACRPQLLPLGRCLTYTSVTVATQTSASG